MEFHSTLSSLSHLLKKTTHKQTGRLSNKAAGTGLLPTVLSLAGSIWVKDEMGAKTIQKNIWDVTLLALFCFII